MSAFLARHGAHIVAFGGPFVLLAGMVAMLELTRPGRPSRRTSLWTWLLAVTWAAAATIHVSVISEHFHEAVVLGVFFLLLSLAQFTYAVAVVLRPSRLLLLVGIGVSASVVLLWTYTRVVAIPFGLGGREPVGAADLTATGLELLAVVVGTLALAPKTKAREAGPPSWPDLPRSAMR